jgi:hypothetical protein
VTAIRTTLLANDVTRQDGVELVDQWDRAALRRF